jgi:hypothetical protein
MQIDMRTQRSRRVGYQYEHDGDRLRRLQHRRHFQICKRHNHIRRCRDQFLGCNTNAFGVFPG